MFSEYFGSKKQINPSSKVSTSKISHAVEGSTSPKLKPSLTKYSSAISSKRPKLNLRSKRLDSQDASVCNENTAHGSPKVKILIDAIPEKTIKVKQTPFFPDKQPYTINRSLSPVFQFTGIKKKVEPLTYKNADDHKKSLTGISNHLKNTIADKSKISVSAGKSSIIPEQKIETGEELLEAVKRSHFDKVLNILSRNDDLSDIINIRGENSWAPMHFACWIGNLNIVNLLYYNQADINAVARGGITPVMVCCIKGGIKLLNHLISMRVCLDQTDENGNNVLHFAAKSGCVECVRALINSHKVDILLKNSEGKAPIDLVKTADQRKALVDACNQSDEYNQERLIQIASVKNENFLMLDSDKRLIRTAETDSTSRSRDVEEVGPKDFVIHAQIGRGSFGEVYLVEKKATGMLYAMKILYKNKMARKLFIT